MRTVDEKKDNRIGESGAARVEMAATAGAGAENAGAGKVKDEKAATAGAAALSEAERTVLERLRSAGYEAVLVGGCVRDRLIAGPDSKALPSGPRPGGTDIDIATNALPGEVKTVFNDMKVIETGIKHGTVTVLAPRTSTAGDPAALTPATAEAPGAALISIEITTYRTDGRYSDGRHPDDVTFTPSLEEDLARRDFTVNAVAMDADGRVIDPFGGRADIANGIIRAVGDPDERFNEDGLRVMRALRFASVLGFDIEPQTERALFRNREKLLSVSVERIFEEFRKLLTGARAGDVVRRYVDILGTALPELSAMKGFEQHNEYHKYDVLEHCVRAMEAVRTNEKNHGYMKMAALLHDVGKPLTYSDDDVGRGHFYGHASKGADVAKEIFRRFKADKALTEHVCLLIKYHDLIFEKDERLLKKWMNRFGSETLPEILEIKIADNLATGNMSKELMAKFEDIREMIRRIVEEGQCFSVADLAVNGNDIKAMGIKEGPEIGAILNTLLEAVIDGGTPNEKDALMALISRS